jgi:hypothetical protein
MDSLEIHGDRKRIIRIKCKNCRGEAVRGKYVIINTTNRSILINAEKTPCPHCNHSQFFPQIFEDDWDAEFLKLAIQTGRKPDARFVRTPLKDFYPAKNHKK